MQHLSRRAGHALTCLIGTLVVMLVSSFMLERQNNPLAGLCWVITLTFASISAALLAVLAITKSDNQTADRS